VVLDSDAIIELSGKYGLPLLVFALACYYTDRNLLHRVQDVKGATLRFSCHARVGTFFSIRV
jgi:hypothetical protein